MYTTTIVKHFKTSTAFIVCVRCFVSGKHNLSSERFKSSLKFTKQMLEPAFPLTIWVSVAILVAMITVGINATKTVTDTAKVNV